MVYLAKKNGSVIYHTDLQAMKDLDGISKPDKTVTVQEWEAAGSTAHIDSAGNIVLGESEDVFLKKKELAELKTEETLLLKELAEKDYEVVKASEVGNVLSKTDPALHTRRDWCRNRINEIRARLLVLQKEEAAA
jgi:hypothetical protein